jgi:Zn-dependent protease/CBS domain-containing protein
MFGKTWTIGRIRGIELRVDTSWLLIAAFVTYSFFVRFEELYDDLSNGEAIALGLAGAVVFFGSVLLHELAHSFVSLARGIPVESITLFLFGGATAARVESRGPKEEFLISVVGPLTSAVLGIVLAIVASAVDSSNDAIGGAIGYLAWLNLSLAVFNLLPGFPLDGGRVFRSIVWAITGDLRRSTRIAASAGRAVGYGIAFLGVLTLFGPGAGGLWLIFIGWFLAQAANASYAELELRQALEGVEADDVMITSVVTVPTGLSLQDAVDQYFMRFDHSSFPVEDGGRVVGLLPLRSVRRVPPEDRPLRTVGQTMTPLDELPVVSRHHRLVELLDRFDDEASRVLVRDGDEIVGMITPRDVSRWLQRKQQLGGRARAAS